MIFIKSRTTFSGPRGVAVDDLTNDGNDDIVATFSGSGAIVLFAGDGSGQFTENIISEGNLKYLVIRGYCSCIY